jgi:hypothetical protein
MDLLQNNVNQFEHGQQTEIVMELRFIFTLFKLNLVNVKLHSATMHFHIVFADQSEQGNEQY